MLSPWILSVTSNILDLHMNMPLTTCFVIITSWKIFLWPYDVLWFEEVNRWIGFYSYFLFNSSLSTPWTSVSFFISLLSLWCFSHIIFLILLLLLYEKQNLELNIIHGYNQNLNLKEDFYNLCNFFVFKVNRFYLFVKAKLQIFNLHYPITPV